MLEAGIGEAAGERLDQPDPLGREGFRVPHHVAVVERRRELVRSRLPQAKLGMNHERLPTADLVCIDADVGLHLDIADEDRRLLALATGRSEM